MSNLLTIEDCDIIVRKCLRTETAKTLDYSVVNFQKQNFLVEIATANKTLKFFAKSGYKSATINHIVDEFNTTVPNFDPKITPQLYFTKADFFVFEDLSWQGFKNYNPESSFAPEHVKTVLKVLAKLHAGSFAYEEIKTKQTQKVYRLNQDYKLKSSSVDLQNPEVTKLISSVLGSSEVVKNLEDRQSSTTFRRALCHGNVTFDNVMFKDPTECKLINFESIAYAPPAVDVLQTIFFNCGEDQRQLYYHSFLAYYYDCLNVELNNYGVKIDDIVTIEEWQAQIHQFLPLIKLQCLQINQLVSPDELKEDLTSSLLSRQDCYAIIAKKLKTTNYHLLSFKVTHLDAISGFLGEYHRLQIKLRHQADINCFVKRVPKSTAAKNVVSDSNSFVKEAFVYNTLIPKFEQLGINMITDCLPQCYFHRPNDILVFEDMNALNYQVTSALVPHDFDTLCLIIKKVAKFHASAFVYEEKMSEKLGHRYRLSDEFGEYFKESLVVDEEDHWGGRLMANGARGVLHATTLFPEFQTPENRDNLSKFFPEMMKLFYSTVSASDRFRNVLSHGDLWTSNILLKFDNDKAVDCSFVDYQLLRYCPPGHDFLSVVHLTTIRDIRLKHEDALKRVYYDELSRLVENFGYDVATILTYDDFLGGVDVMRPQMVLQAAIYSMFSMCTAEQISSLLKNDEKSVHVFFEDRSEFLNKMVQLSPIYRSRVGDRIQDLYHYCQSMSK